MTKYYGKNSYYEFMIDEEKKVLHSKASGYFSLEDAVSFIKDFKNLSKSLPANTYTLFIDPLELKPSAPEVTVELIEVLKIYAEFPFKQRLVITNGNLFTIIQVKRLGADVPGWSEGVQYLDDFEEAMKRI